MIVEKAMEGFTFGCDPELFVVNSDGEFVSAEGLIPGTKSDPFKVDRGAVQVDGMAAEFNIDPVTTFEEFHASITSVMKDLKKMLPRGHKLIATPAVTFSDKVWEAAPQHAKELGCSPDYNAWTGEVNPPPSDPSNPTLRTASGHLHIGWVDDVDIYNKEHMGHCRDLAKQLDYYLGVWSLQKDEDATRRRLYGKAGSIRFKPYGVEYRVLSNFWLKDKRTMLETWNRMQAAINNMSSSFIPDQAYSFNELVVKSIDTSTRDQSLEHAYHFPILSKFL